MNREQLGRIGWTPELLQRLKSEAGDDEERLLALLRRYAPRESIDVAVRAGEGNLRAIETNRATRRGEVTSIAEMLADRVEYEIRGKPAQKEEGVAEILGRLTRYLSRGGKGWKWSVRAVSARDEKGVDGDIVPPAGEPIEVQVTRPVPSTDYLARVARGDDAKVSMDTAAVAGHVIAAIQAKDLLSGRADTVLALDAVSLTHLVLPEVVERVKSAPGVIGFKAVFLVGPSDELVFRLAGGDAFLRT
jgi:hypothetical protein